MTFVWIAIDVILIQPLLKYVMSACATLFPFFSATEIEFKLLQGKEMIDSNVLFNNDDYFSLSSLSKLGSKHDKNIFFVLHLNTRSLTKNHDEIEEFKKN